MREVKKESVSDGVRKREMRRGQEVDNWDSVCVCVCVREGE